MTSISSPSPANPGDDGLVPPRLGMAPPVLPWYRLLAAVRTNALSAWSPQAYEQDFVAASFLGRDRLLINNPEGIRRVLVDNHTNYRRTRATIRIIRPLMGDGVFLSEGDDWRHQRHTLAPAFTPRALPLLTRHIAKATQDALVRLDAMAQAGPVDLIATCQYLTLDIAGRSMFSLEMSRHGPTMRRLLARYGAKLGRP
jgi:cytochrome P450